MRNIKRLCNSQREAASRPVVKSLNHPGREPLRSVSDGRYNVLYANRSDGSVYYIGLVFRAERLTDPKGVTYNREEMIM